VSSNSTCQLFLVHKDKDGRLSFQRKGTPKKALVVLEILDTVDYFMNCVDHIRAVPCMAVNPGRRSFFSTVEHICGGNVADKRTQHTVRGRIALTSARLLA
jgi:hypothetical protein